MKTYQGSCQCKRVRFEVDIDLATAQTTKCNCTACWKRRWWGVPVKPDRFRLLAGADELVKWRPARGLGGFCKHCGIAPFATVDAAEWNDGEYISVNMSSLDGVEPATLLAARVLYLDGLHDTWQPIEGETRHL